MKICNDCKQEKEDSEFHKNQKICKVCKAVRYKSHYANNQEIYLKRNHDRRKKFRAILSEIKRDLSCIQCGETHEAILDFHHKDPTTKDFSIADFVSAKSPSEKNVSLLNEEIVKCMTLCSNCHRKLHWYETHND